MVYEARAACLYGFVGLGVSGMDKMIELEFKLRDGGSYYLCDTKFSVMSGRIRRQINAIDHVVEHYASVNGIAVKHSYEEVVEMIRKAKGAK